MGTISADVGTHSVYLDSATAAGGVDIKRHSANTDIVINDIPVKAVNDKHHATTVFHGDMTDLFVNDESSPGSNDFGNLYNTANTKFDFTTESTASATNGYDVLANSAFGVDKISATIVTSDTAGLHLQNTASAKGGIRSGALTTVAGRTYQLDITHTETSQSWVTSDLYIAVGTGAGESSLVNGTNSDGGFSTTFVATSAETHITLGPDSTTDTSVSKC